jgi:hypothetical protein
MTELAAKSSSSLQNKAISFPTKLWMVINTPDNKFIQWHRDGETVFINSQKLDEYLQTTESLFDICSSDTFFHDLKLHGFQRVPPILQFSDSVDFSSLSVWQEYFHANFQRNAANLLGGIVKPKYDVTFPLNKQIKRDHGDPCHRHVKFDLSATEAASLNLKLTLQMNYVNHQLNKALSELGSNEEANVIEIPQDFFDEPMCVELPLYAANREIAGNYGHVLTEQLKMVFGDYLPLYADKIEMMDCENVDLTGNGVSFCIFKTSNPMNTNFVFFLQFQMMSHS